MTTPVNPNAERAEAEFRAEYQFHLGEGLCESEALRLARLVRDAILNPRPVVAPTAPARRLDATQEILNDLVAGTSPGKAGLPAATHTKD